MLANTLTPLRSLTGRGGNATSGGAEPHRQRAIEVPSPDASNSGVGAMVQASLLDV
jgi:hypothetical protein